MSSRVFVDFCACVVACAACSSSPPNSNLPASDAQGGGAGAQSLAGSPGSAGASLPFAGNGGALIATGGSSTSSAGLGGASGDATSAADTSSAGSTSLGGALNTVPAGYAGTPFKTLTIPGFIYAADYDKGGSGIAYCRVGAAMPPNAATCGMAKINDWCCGTQKGCDERTQPAACPIYRQDDDNAGLSHMNTGEPDNYAVTGPTWVAGANGPTLTGPMETAGTAVPQHANTTTSDDAYISYMFTGQWENYTVQVMEAGTYSIGGLMAIDGGTVITLDFGNGVTTGPMALPASPINDCKCPETYHSWNVVSNVGSVTFPAAGTYLMRFTLVADQFNPLYFTFTKM